MWSQLLRPSGNAVDAFEYAWTVLSHPRLVELTVGVSDGICAIKVDVCKPYGQLAMGPPEVGAGENSNPGCLEQCAAELLSCPDSLGLDTVSYGLEVRKEVEGAIGVVDCDSSRPKSLRAPLAERLEDSPRGIQVSLYFWATLVRSD